MDIGEREIHDADIAGDLSIFPADGFCSLPGRNDAIVFHGKDLDIFIEPAQHILPEFTEAVRQDHGAEGPAEARQVQDIRD